NNLALLYNQKGDLNAAERLHREALEYVRQQLGEDRPEFARSLNNLAHVYKDQRRFSDAEPLFMRAAEILEKTHGIRHPNTLKALSALIEIYDETGNQEATERLMAKITSTLEAIPEEHRHVLHRLPGLTDMFRVLQSVVQQMPNEQGQATVSSEARVGDWASPSYQRLLAQCADAFVKFEYGSCFRKAILLNTRDATHEVVQMFIICGTRVPSTESSVGQDNKWQPMMAILRSLVNDPWFGALVDLTLGLKNEHEIEALVSDDEQRCQFLYYKA